jgi:hypothetical protein
VQRLLAHQTKAPPPISRERADVPESLSAIINKMMQKRKEDRYQSAADAAAALSKWLVENGGSKWRQSHPALVARFASLDDVPRRRPDAAPNTDRRSGEAKPAGSPVAASRPGGSGKPKKSRPSSPVVLAKSAPLAPPTPQVDALAEIVHAAPVAEVAPGEAAASHPMWISAPPSAPLAAPPLPAVVRTSPNNRIDRRVIYLASLVIGAVLLVAGVGYRLVAGTDEENPSVVEPEAPKQPTKSTIGP